MVLVTIYMIGLCTAVLGSVQKQLVTNDASATAGSIQCGPNEIPTTNKIICPPQTCDSIYTLYSCIETPPVAGCDCVDNYLRNSSGICIPSDQCPSPSELLHCGPNEVPTTDRIVCPPQTCDSIYKSFQCEVKPPEPGCDCLQNYLRNATGVCIPSDECPSTPVSPPKCGLNEVATDNAIICPPQTCESLYTMYDCLPNLPVPGCNCIDGYFRNASGICVPTDECPPRVYDIKCGPNEIKKDKKTECPPQTCESLYTINFCLPQDPEPGCDCIEGYLRNDFGTCIPSSECPTYDNDFGDSDESEESDYDTNSVSSTTSQSSSSSSSTSQSTSSTNSSD